MVRFVEEGTGRVEGAGLPAGATMRRLRRNPDLRPSPHGKNLAGMDLSRQDLSSMDLSGADLTGANLRGASLIDASLSGANLSFATLTGANLKGADLTGVDLRGANLKDADLSGRDLRGHDLSGANLSFATLTGANLKSANLSGANLSSASFSDAYLGAANLSRANCYGAGFQDADLEGANLSGAKLTFARLAGANLKGADLTGVDLRSATLTGANLAGANLSGADFKNAYLAETDFTGVDLTQALNVPRFGPLREHYEIKTPTSPAFKRWFGDSVVVGDDKKPVVVYHGTDRGGFTQFDPSKRDPQHNAFYFTNSMDVAETYIDNRNPQTQLDPVAEPGDAKGIYRLYIKLVNPMIIEGAGRSWAGLHDPRAPGLHKTYDLAKWAEAHGHDGVIFKDIVDSGGRGAKPAPPATVYAVFDPRAIKSATANVGSYDPDDADIRHNPRHRLSRAPRRR